MISQLPTVDDEGVFWRVVITDTESLSGVAPVCTQTDSHYTEGVEGIDHLGVYDCCPGPHLECWGEGTAAEVVAFLNARTVRICE